MTYLSTVLGLSPLVHLTLDETATSFADSSGNGYTFTIGASAVTGLTGFTIYKKEGQPERLQFGPSRVKR